MRHTLQGTRPIPHHLVDLTQRRLILLVCLFLAAASLQLAGAGQAHAGDEIPTTTKTVQVKDGATLATALSGATADTTILLGDGTYTGTFSLSGKVPTLPIVVKAANPGKAIFAWRRRRREPLPDQPDHRVQPRHPPGKIHHAVIITARRPSASHDTPRVPLQY